MYTQGNNNQTDDTRSELMDVPSLTISSFPPFLSLSVFNENVSGLKLPKVTSNTITQNMTMFGVSIRYKAFCE